MNPGLRAGLALSLLLIGLLAIGFVWAGRDISPDLARIERIHTLLEKHPQLLWRQRPNLTTTFEGAAVRTDGDGFRLTPGAETNEQAGFRIVTLGASPTFGYGVEAAEAYPRVAEAALQADERNLRVVNAGQIGYSSWQGLKVFDQFASHWSPELVTVSYVVNDIDRLRFFFTNGREDKDTAASSGGRIAFDNFLARFGPTAFLSRHTRRLLVKLVGERMVRGSYELAHVRVSAADYEANLRRFVRECREGGIALVLIKMPFNLPEALPPQPAGLDQRLSEAGRALEQGDFAQARRIAEQAQAEDPYHSSGYYLQGKALVAAGEAQPAQRAFQQAMEHLIYDCARDARRYNEIMARVANETDTP
ncbi:MAG: hypothetical protein ACTSXZ_07920, partial [Alphaproteobacteria bacterium]